METRAHASGGFPRPERVSLLNLGSQIPIKDLRKLVYAKLNYADKELVKLAHDSTASVDQVFKSVRFQNACAQFGYLPILKYNAKHLHRGVSLSQHAALGGQLHVLEWLRFYGYAFNTNTCANAARAGHLHVLKWMRDNNCPWYELVGHTAAYGGHLDVLRWAVEIKCPVHVPVQLRQVLDEPIRAYLESLANE
jgi:hypothetical protein